MEIAFQTEQSVHIIVGGRLSGVSTRRGSTVIINVYGHEKGSVSHIQYLIYLSNRLEINFYNTVELDILTRMGPSSHHRDSGGFYFGLLVQDCYTYVHK